eukprot:TRINITY_DN32965_c0_g1_i1.p2 TRINITY_DN32965_c0_g1~~TRINITY_DN32965_c0_g1_i1.p2  ORF type:complete len:138 (+),score=3.69 TRINITY_DN32965_c0_g1_i1:160-573(+)
MFVLPVHKAERTAGPEGTTGQTKPSSAAAHAPFALSGTYTGHGQSTDGKADMHLNRWVFWCMSGASLPVAAACSLAGAETAWIFRMCGVAHDLPTDDDKGSILCVLGSRRLPVETSCSSNRPVYLHHLELVEAPLLL